MRERHDSVTDPPSERALMVYDGECNFCCQWISRWKLLTGDQIDYITLQDIGDRFPEISLEDYQRAAHLILCTGEVFKGADAVLKALADVPGKRWLHAWYRQSVAFAGLAEWSYRLVAEHRPKFSFFSNLLIGKNPEPSTYIFSSWLFVKCLGLIGLIAFISLWIQAAGLFGSDGIMPLATFLENAASFLNNTYPGDSFYQYFPTLFWLGDSDAAITGVFVGGVVSSLLMIAGVCPALGALGVFLCYLSVMIAGQDFMSFQWDSLLVEMAFLTVFLAPWMIVDRLGTRPEPLRLTRLLVWWLLFRLMLESGVVKLNHWDYPSDSNTWQSLTAMNYHYWTQPIPSWISWHVHNYSPVWLHQFSIAMMFVIEIGLPFFIFGPRRVRNFGCLGMLSFQVLIMLTGNYGFFNLLTMALCLCLIDDQSLPSFIRRRWSERHHMQRSGRLLRVIQGVVLLPVTIVILIVSSYQMVVSFEGRRPAIGHPAVFEKPPEWAQGIFDKIRPFHIVNSYGLFRVMTTTRPEIIIEGSIDGVSWSPYRFKYMAGDPAKRPGIIVPHMPRLDWRMWFAGLQYEHNKQVRPWFMKFIEQLLNGNENVIALLEENPFTDQPPQYLRMQLYLYTFSDPVERRENGVWWRRQKLEQYMIQLSLKK